MSPWSPRRVPPLGLADRPSLRAGRKAPSSSGNGTLPVATCSAGASRAARVVFARSLPQPGREDSNPMRGPMGDFVRRALSWGIVLVLLLPILLSVVSGLAALLAALGDEGGARLCWRAVLLAAVVWLLAVVATSVLAGLAALAAERGGRRCGPPSRHRQRHDSRRPGRRRRDGGWPSTHGESSGDGSGDDGPPPRHDPRPG